MNRIMRKQKIINLPPTPTPISLLELEMKSSELLSVTSRRGPKYPIKKGSVTHIARVTTIDLAGR